MSDVPEDRPLVDDLAEQVEDLPGESSAPATGGLEGDEPEGESYDERDEREEGRA